MCCAGHAAHTGWLWTDVRTRGSHGQSMVVSPYGNILARAPRIGEFIVLQDLDMSLLPAEPYWQSDNPFLHAWYDEAASELVSSMPID